MNGDDRIVTWAERSAHIRLRCKVCGAKFHTKNLHYIGARTLFMAMHPFEEFEKCLECDNAGHTLEDLEVIVPEKGGE